MMMVVRMMVRMISVRMVPIRMEAVGVVMPVRPVMRVMIGMVRTVILNLSGFFGFDNRLLRHIRFLLSD